MDVGGHSYGFTTDTEILLCYSDQVYLSPSVSGSSKGVMLGELYPFVSPCAGVIGDWKNFFSKEEEAAFNEVFRAKLGGTILAERYLKA